MDVKGPLSVHSALPDELTAAVDGVLVPAGLRHVVHANGEPVRAAAVAADDSSAIALIGPYRSADVAEAVEVSAPAGLPLLAPLATWAGVTRDDEPGCEDAARHQGTVFRMVARDTVVAERIAAWVRSAGHQALVIAGGHEYGRQLDGQLSVAGLPRAEDPAEADLVVLAGLSDGPEIARAADLSPLPVLAFDGVQGATLGDDGREIRLALPLGPHPGITNEALFAGVPCACRAAELVVAAARGGAPNRGALLACLRALGAFDDHGDPIDPAVWRWRAGPGWTLHPEGSL
jgi:hypothetical protein